MFIYIVFTQSHFVNVCAMIWDGALYTITVTIHKEFTCINMVAVWFGVYRLEILRKYVFVCLSRRYIYKCVDSLH